jgi:spermidine/putrescine transport system ATP-binding protein
MAIADTIVVMNAGRIEDRGTPARIYGDPATAFTAGFMGEVNMIDGTGDGNRIATGLGLLPGTLKGAVKVAIRPEHLAAGGSVDLGRARVIDLAFFGTYCRAKLESAAGTLHAQMPPDEAPQVGDSLHLSTQPHHIKVYPA